MWQMTPMNTDKNSLFTIETLTQRPSAADRNPKDLTAKNTKNAERGKPEFLTAKYAEYTKEGREVGIL